MDIIWDTELLRKVLQSLRAVLIVLVALVFFWRVIRWAVFRKDFAIRKLFLFLALIVFIMAISDGILVMVLPEGSGFSQLIPIAEGAGALVLWMADHWVRERRG